MTQPGILLAYGGLVGALLTALFLGAVWAAINLARGNGGDE